MPEKMEKALKKSAEKHEFKGKRFKRYVYGGLQNIEKRKEHMAKMSPGKKK